MTATARRTSEAAVAKSWHSAASRTMKAYSERGVFRGPISEEHSRGSVLYSMRWHRNREFRITIDRAKKIARVAVVLPAMPSKSDMYREYVEFIDSFQDGSRPAHRSVDQDKASVVVGSRSGSASLTFKVRDGDYEYAVKKLLALIHETYLTFIPGPYDAYRVEHLGADPDWGH